MTLAAQHLRLAEEGHRRLAVGAASIALWAAMQFAGVDRTQVFRAARWPAPPAKARAICVYILTTYLDFQGDAAAEAIGVSDRKYVWKLKERVTEERERDKALDLFLDEIGAIVAGRKAA